MPPTDPSANGGEHEVFGALPRTRPQRRSAKRDRPPQKRKAPANGVAGKGSDAGADAAVPPVQAGATTARPRTTSARAKIGADAKRPRKAAPAPESRATVPPAGYATPAEARRASQTDILSTAVHAGGELVEIGATLAGQALKSMLGRLPRP